VSIDLNARIPNNVGLADHRQLQRALERWQPSFIQWWRERGPVGLQERDVYLRTAVDVTREGWAQYDYVRMPGELRATLRRLIVTQGDTEPASVEQQRRLGASAPSLYDLRNLLQVNVEEARHLWAMVYLLFRHFGRDGREEAEELLARSSGEADRPRILGAFNRPISTWLDFFCFTTFTDRDGKYQLAALAESGFDPLSRTTRFMLTEEAHHLFVGETGIRRIVARTAELMREDPNGDARAAGGIDLALLQRFINHWYTESLDLFGSPDSSNAASYFATGVKGRYQESRAGGYDDHRLTEGVYEVEQPRDDGMVGRTEVPARRATNAMLLEAYVRECHKSLTSWNRTLERAGLPERLTLPSPRFNRKIGPFADRFYTPDGEPSSASSVAHHLPTDADREWLDSLQERAVLERGQCAHWIAPPSHPINGQPLDFAYVR
jgi:benzoyl-CoA 2,3-dioxygenase component B